jgi:hypothetical protein
MKPEHKYLKSSELAQLEGKCIKSINRSFNKNGIPQTNRGWGNGQTKRPFTGGTPKSDLPRIDDPKIWDNKEWFVEMCYNKGYGLRKIARITNRHRQTIKLYFRRYGIKPHHRPTSISFNPCCTYKWLEDHYVLQGLTLRRCANLANVNPYSIYNWLVRFGIHIRDIHEAMAGDRNPNYGKRLRKKGVSNKDSTQTGTTPVSTETSSTPNS